MLTPLVRCVPSLLHFCWPVLALLVILALLRTPPGSSAPFTAPVQTADEGAFGGDADSLLTQTKSNDHWFACLALSQFHRYRLATWRIAHGRGRAEVPFWRDEQGRYLSCYREMKAQVTPAGVRAAHLPDL